MKVDIITLHAALNYGAVLQAFATQEFFRQNGCEARIINAVFPHHKPCRRLIKLCSKGNKFMFPFKILPVSLALLKSFISIETFRKKYLIMSDEKEYTTPEDFAKYESDADAFCTGSDQTWTPNYPEEFKPLFHLSFVPKGSYKFSFAASFGVSELSSEEAAKFQEYINDYKYISVRENSGLIILREQFHYDNAVCTLDPTLCLDGDTWRSYVKYTTGRGVEILTYSCIVLVMTGIWMTMQNSLRKKQV